MIPEILCFGSGLILGGLIYRFFIANTAETESLSKALDEIQAEYANYQQDVDIHFKRSADLFKQLTESYSEVHQHLSEGAQNLSHHPMRSEMIVHSKDGQQRLPSSSQPEDQREPKDIAPEIGHQYNINDSSNSAPTKHSEEKI